MNNLLNNSSKNARHFLLAVVCFLMTAGIFSCSKDSFEVKECSLRKNMTDEEILEWQKNMWTKTRTGDAPIGVVVTTNTDVTYHIASTENIIVNWGDGNIDTLPPGDPTVPMKYIYTDGLPGHSITFTGSPNSLLAFISTYSGIIYADFSRSINLEELTVSGNRLTSIYLKDNSNLSILYVDFNNLSSLDMDNLTKLRIVWAGFNPLLSTINVKSAATNLENLDVSGSQIVNLDISENTNLIDLCMNGTEIVPIDLSSYTKLRRVTLSNPYEEINLTNMLYLKEFHCSSTKIKHLDLSNNSSIKILSCTHSDVEDIILPNLCNDLEYVNVSFTPIEQNRRKIVNFAYSLPDRNNMTPGQLTTCSPYIEFFKEDVEAYNWIVR